MGESVAMRGIAVLFTLLASALNPSPGRAVVFGFNNNAVAQKVATAEQSAQLLQDVGAQVDRFTFNWRYAELKPRQYRLQIYDQIYAADLRHGIQPLFTLLFAPDWTWRAGVSCGPSQMCPFPPGPHHLAAWRRMVRVLVRRYPRMAGLEIWNEPNLVAFWRPFPNPAYYTRLVRQAKRAVHQAHSHVPIIAGALSNAPLTGGTPGIGAKTFLNAMYRHHARHHFDALSIHPYPIGNDLAPTFKTITEIDDARARHHDRTPIWVTEIGATAPRQLSEAGQSDLLVRLLELLGGRADIQAVLVHTLVEPPFGPQSGETGYGIVKAGGRPRPAYCGLAALRLHSPSACPPQLLQPRPNADQELRWDAMVAVQSQVDAASAYARRHHGLLKGFSTGGPSPEADQQPGSSADPARVGLYPIGSGSQGATLLCAASRADTSYCAMYAGGSWNYGYAAGSIGAAVGSTLHRQSVSW